ncbi:MAG: type II secretion system protein [Phycisphaeraceae bacterium]
MHRHHGFTLVELLVVIAIIGIVVALTLPALSAARRSGRRAVCGSNLHQMAIASELYLSDHDDWFWPYYEDQPDGRRWWFGFEPGGPGTGMKNRPLDVSRSVLAPYLGVVTDEFQCPSFDYQDADYFPKFENGSASYGFNLHLSEGRRTLYTGRTSEVFLFADGIHFDSSPGYNEGHYLSYTSNTRIRSGYAHFRHQGSALVQYLDGHVAGQPLDGDAHADVGGGPAGNLTADDGTNAIYGF